MSAGWSVNQVHGKGSRTLDDPMSWRRNARVVRTSGSAPSAVAIVQEEPPNMYARGQIQVFPSLWRSVWPPNVVARGRTDTSVEEWRTIQGPLIGRYVLREPVLIHLWIDNGEYVADAPNLNLHGFGADDVQALTDVRERIVEEYEFLRSEADRLSPRMTAMYAALAEVLGEPIG